MVNEVCVAVTGDKQIIQKIELFKKDTTFLVVLNQLGLDSRFCHVFVNGFKSTCFVNDPDQEYVKPGDTILVKHNGINMRCKRVIGGQFSVFFVKLLSGETMKVDIAPERTTIAQSMKKIQLNFANYYIFLNKNWNIEVGPNEVLFPGDNLLLKSKVVKIRLSMVGEINCHDVVLPKSNATAGKLLKKFGYNPLLWECLLVSQITGTELVNLDYTFEDYDRVMLRKKPLPEINK